LNTSSNEFVSETTGLRDFLLAANQSQTLNIHPHMSLELISHISQASIAPSANCHDQVAVNHGPE
jgi:hypothetical protein